MKLLRSLGRASVRLGGAAVRGSRHVLVAHVVPDTLIPSRKTTRKASSASKLILLSPLKWGYTAFKRYRKKRRAAGTVRKAGSFSPRPAGTVRPSSLPRPSKAPKPFNRGAWGRGASLPSSSSGFGNIGPAGPPSRKPPRVRQKGERVLHDPRFERNQKRYETKKARENKGVTFYNH